jgi:predicted transcriptional regulator
METTTIQIRKSLKRKLDELKIYPNETMDQLIERLADNKIDREPLSKEEIKGIEEGLEDIKAGKVYTTKQLKKNLGVK